MTLDLVHQSCAGTHIFQALVKIDHADRSSLILDKTTHEQLHTYLRATVTQIIKHQEVEGAWSWSWCDSINRNDGAPITLKERILVTGHILEVLNDLDSNLRPPDSVYEHALAWLNESLLSNEIRTDDGSWLCPFTHAARAQRKIMLQQKRL
jgi:hypothetical protein